MKHEEIGVQEKKKPPGPRCTVALKFPTPRLSVRTRRCALCSSGATRTRTQRRDSLSPLKLRFRFLSHRT